MTFVFLAGSSPLTSGPLPDGRTGRQLLVYGVPPNDAGIRDYGVDPKDAANTAYPTIQLQGYRKPEWPKTLRCEVYVESPSSSRNKAEKGVNCYANYRARGAVQVRLCRGGIIKGETSTVAKPTSGISYNTDWAAIWKRMCHGKATPAKLDALYREAVAYARFQLARKWKEMEKNMATTSSSHPCSKSKWDAMGCMNTMFSDDSKAQCYLVDVLHAGFKAGKTKPANWKEFGLPFDRVKFMTDGASLGLPYGLNSGPRTIGQKCSEGGEYAGKCTVKVCHSELLVFVEDYASVTLQWKYKGKTITKTNLSGGGDKKWLVFKWDGEQKESRPEKCAGKNNVYGREAGCTAAEAQTPLKECPQCHRFNVFNECTYADNAPKYAPGFAPTSAPTAAHRHHRHRSWWRRRRL